MALAHTNATYTHAHTTLHMHHYTTRTHTHTHNTHTLTHSHSGIHQAIARGGHEEEAEDPKARVRAMGVHSMLSWVGGMRPAF